MQHFVETYVDYNSDEEYQHAICELFQIQSANDFFENRRFLEVLDKLYDTTITTPLFHEIYELAAAKLFSTDKKMGLTVLFAYTFLREFHKYLSDFMGKKDTTDSYRALMDLL